MIRSIASRVSCGGPADQGVADRRPALWSGRRARLRARGRSARRRGPTGRGGSRPWGSRPDASDSLAKTFDPSSSAATLLGAEDPEPFALEGVDDPEDERLFRADDGQADPFPLGELRSRPRMSPGLDRHVLRLDRRAGVPRRAEDSRDPFRLAPASSRGRVPAPPCRQRALSRRRPPPVVYSTKLRSS